MWQTLIRRLFRCGHRRSAAPPVQTRQRVVRVFISSTFKDMQRERDALARFVFPFLRERFAQEDVSIFEVDLRWGITEAESKDALAVKICLDEIDNCAPFFIAMLGERYGWRPTQAHLDNAGLHLSASANAEIPSVTELEIRRALENAASASVAPLFFFRTPDLSGQIGEQADDPQAMAELKALIRHRFSDEVCDYSDIGAFGEVVRSALGEALKRWLDDRTSAQASLAPPDVPRSTLSTRLNDAATAGAPILLTGPPGCGISWLGARWLDSQSKDRGHFAFHLDGRNAHMGNLADALRREREAIHPNLSVQPLPTGSLEDEIHGLIGDVQHLSIASLRLFIDHFEDGYLSEQQVDISALPRRLPKNVRIVVASRSKWVLRSAADMGLGILKAPAIDQATMQQFIRDYLSPYGKRLMDAQVRLLATAPYADRLGTVVVCLDELRRHRSLRDLDERIQRLIACKDEADLARHVLRGIRISLPEAHSTAIDGVLVALVISLRGLTENELCETVRSRNGDRLPPQVWSCIRIGLGRALLWRGARIDLVPGPMRGAAEARANEDPELTSRIGGDLLVALRRLSIKRWAEEAPMIAARTNGEPGLESHLSDLGNARMLLNVGRIYAAGWLNRLTPATRRRVFDAWCAQLESWPIADDDQGIGWDLGHFAAQTDAPDQALRLWELDARRGHRQPHRDLSEILLIKDASSAARAQALERRSAPTDAESIRKMSLDAVALHWTESAAMLGAAAEGLVSLSRERRDRWCVQAIASAERLGEGAVLAQAHLLQGQLEISFAEWRSAARSFDLAAKHARSVGHARRLATALERGAAVCLELNRFKRARNLSEQLLSLSRECDLPSDECRAFERLIEIERRRANWERAFEIAEAYLRRAKELGTDQGRAREALDSLTR